MKILQAGMQAVALQVISSMLIHFLMTKMPIGLEQLFQCGRLEYQASFQRGCHASC